MYKVGCVSAVGIVIVVNIEYKTEGGGNVSTESVWPALGGVVAVLLPDLDDIDSECNLTLTAYLSTMREPVLPKNRDVRVCLLTRYDGWGIG